MASQQEVDRQERRMIRNRLAQFPDEVLDVLDTYIRKGMGTVNLLKYLKLEYKGPLPIPNPSTLDKWRQIRKKKFQESADVILASAKAVSELPPIPDLRSVDPDDRPKLLYSVQRVLADRIEKLREIQENVDDPRYEKMITENLVALKDTIQASVEMEDKLGSGLAMIEATLKIVLRQISGAVTRAYRDAHGEKADMGKFRKSLERQFDLLNLEVIETEVRKFLSNRESKKAEPIEVEAS